MTGVFLQVRLSSSRLPRKALRVLAGRTVIEHAMDSLSRVDADVFALLTDNESRFELEPLAANCGFEVFPGPADDVLERYALAVRHYGVDRYMRATGDNPLVSWELAMDLLELHVRENADFSGFLGPPLGTGIELTESSAILIAAEKATDPYEREHVSPYIYHRPAEFTVLRPWVPAALSLPGSKVTLDTVEDYRFLETIYSALYEDGPIPVKKLVDWLVANETTESKDTLYPVGKTG